MTRAKEITKEAKKFAKEIDDWEIAEDVQDAFEQGARWADRTMIENACKWLKKQLQNTTLNEEPLFNEIEETLEDFRKAMKGGNQ